MSRGFLHICNNPVVQIKLGELRDAGTPPPRFRQLLYEISIFLISQALRGIPIERNTNLITPTGEIVKDHRFTKKVSFVPILRAALPMADAGLMLLPNSEVYHLGIRRNEATLRPNFYYENRPVPEKTSHRHLVLDPMLATGGSASMALSRVKEWGVKDVAFVCIIAAPEGVRKLFADHHDVGIFTAALDRGLNDKGYILPGLGDAGDRQFGT